MFPNVAEYIECLVVEFSERDNYTKHAMGLSLFGGYIEKLDNTFIYPPQAIPKPI